MKNVADYESIHSVNPLYFVFGEVEGYIEEKKCKEILNFGFYR